MSVHSDASKSATASKRGRREAGLTLVEVLVAMFLLVFGLLGLAQGTILAIRSNQTALYHVMASNLGRDKLEDLKATSWAGIVSGGPSTEIRNNVVFTRTWTVTPNSPAAGLKRIDVAVTWVDSTARSAVFSSAVEEP